MGSVGQGALVRESTVNSLHLGLKMEGLREASEIRSALFLLEDGSNC